MTPIKFPEHNRVWAEDQPEYQPLPAYTDHMHTITCWQLTWKERIKMLVFGKLWLLQMNFGQALQPQLPSVDAPFTSGPQQ